MKAEEDTLRRAGLKQQNNQIICFIPDDKGGKVPFV